MKTFEIVDGKVVNEESCMLDFNFQFRGDQPMVVLQNTAVADSECLPYPKYRFTNLAEQKKDEIRTKDYHLLYNLYHLGEILGPAGFRDASGSWLSNEDEIVHSESKFSQFFYIDREDAMPKAHISLLLQDIDVLGENNFHTEESGYKRKDKKPAFVVNVKFFGAEVTNDMIEVQQEFDLDHDFLNVTPPNKFRAQKSTRSFVTENNGETLTDCDLQFEMKVKGELVQFWIDDNADTCIPSDTEGTWKLKLTDKEQFEEMIEEDIMQQSMGEGTSKAAK
jgi:hypothetical protein